MEREDGCMVVKGGGMGCGRMMVSHGVDSHGGGGLVINTASTVQPAWPLDPQRLVRCWGVVGSWDLVWVVYLLWRLAE